MGELNGKLSGLCTPKLMLDLPNGNGKVPIYPDPIVARHDETIELRGFNGQVSSYPLE